MKIVSAIDRIESTSYWTVFTAFVASIASRRERSITSRNPSSDGASADRGTGADLSTSFRSDFERAPHHRRKEAVQRCLGGIVVDRTAKVARCYIRPIPLVEGPVGELVEGIENAKRVPDLLIPLRKVGVPGTGLEPARPCGH
jgi:hypothetical protein